MKNFSKLAVAGLMLFVAVEANAGMGTLVVTDVNPVFKTVTRYENVPYTETVCYVMRRNSRGLLEKVVDNGFGSTGGLVGAGVGVAIGEKIGSGSGNDAAKIIGGLIGNKIGNDISERNNKNRTCEEVTQYKRERYTEELIDGYNITGTVGDSFATVKRPYMPKIGEEIRVNVKVW